MNTQSLMSSQFSYLTAFLAGLLGGVHCIGMCGGIVGALGFGLPDSVRGKPKRLLPYLLAYNGGRIASYAALGTLMGGVGMIAAHVMDVRQGQLVLQVAAGLFMVAMGLYLGGWWLGLLKLERAGGLLWRRIEPLGRRLMPVRSPGQALALGLVWGWLPCGLVYSVLIWSISSGSAVRGALLMFAFGLGTLPNLLAMGAFASAVASLFRRPWVRGLAGAMVIALGAITILRPLV